MLSAQTMPMAAPMRHSPYSIPPPRIHSMQHINYSPYSTHFAASTYSHSASPSTFFQGAMFTHPFGSGLSSSSLANTPIASSPILSPTDSSDPAMPSSRGGVGMHASSVASDATPITSLSQTPTSEGEDSFNGQHPMKLSCAYSTTALSNGTLDNGRTNAAIHSPTACSHPSTPHHPASSCPAPLSSSLAGPHVPTGMLSASSMYSPSPSHSHQHPPHQDYSAAVNMGMNIATPSMPTMPVWNACAYSSLPMPNALPNQIPKLSYDSPRYKLTPERAIPLVKWFEEHREHPYPTRHDKMCLCETTQLTFTQVSTWFANARRRMKKANSEEEKSTSSDDSSHSGADSPICSEESNSP